MKFFHNGLKDKVNQENLEQRSWRPNTTYWTRRTQKTKTKTKNKKQKTKNNMKNHEDK